MKEQKTKGNFIFAFHLLRRFGVGYLSVSLLISILEMILPIVNVYGLKVILDHLERKEPIEVILKFLGFMFLLMGISYLISSWYKKVFSPVQIQKMRLKMRQFFYDKAAKTDLKYYDNTDYYNTYVKALSEAEGRLFRLIDQLSGFVGTVSCLVTIIVLAVSMDGFVLLFSIVSIVGSVIFSMVGQKYGFLENNDAVKSQRKFDYVNRIFYLRQYAKEIRSYTLKENLGTMLEQAGEERIAVAKKYVGKQWALSMGVSFLNVVYILGMMAYLAFRVASGVISIGDFAALLTASQTFSGQVEAVFGVIPKLRENLMYIGYLREFANNKSEIEQKEGGVIMPFGCPVEIQFENAAFRYSNMKSDVLQGMNIQIQQGEIIVVVGENGAGKTTMLNLLLRLYDLVEGEIRYNGIPIQEYDVALLRRNIGIIFQDFQQYALTVKENLCFNEEKIEEEEIYRVLEEVGMGERIRQLPLGLHTMIGYEFSQDGVEFSGGEYQKLALARALLLGQGLIIMDEPSSSLDPYSEKNFFDNINKLCVGKTVIIVSHRLAVTKFADRIILIKNHMISEMGTHDELMKLGGDYAEMFRNQAEAFKRS